MFCGELASICITTKVSRVYVSLGISTFLADKIPIWPIIRTIQASNRAASAPSFLVWKSVSEITTNIFRGSIHSLALYAFDVLPVEHTCQALGDQISTSLAAIRIIWEETFITLITKSNRTESTVWYSMITSSFTHTPEALPYAASLLRRKAKQNSSIIFISGFYISDLYHFGTNSRLKIKCSFLRKLFLFDLSHTCTFFTREFLALYSFFTLLSHFFS